MRAYSGEWNTFVTHKRCKLRKQVNRLLVKRMTVGEALKVRRLLGLALIPGFDPIADISCIVCVCLALHGIQSHSFSWPRACTRLVLVASPKQKKLLISDLAHRSHGRR